MDPAGFSVADEDEAAAEVGGAKGLFCGPEGPAGEVLGGRGEEGGSGSAVSGLSSRVILALLAMIQLEVSMRSRD